MPQQSAGASAFVLPSQAQLEQPNASPHGTVVNLQNAISSLKVCYICHIYVSCLQQQANNIIAQESNTSFIAHVTLTLMWLHVRWQVRSDTVKSMISSPSAGCNRPPRSPVSSNSIAARDSQACTQPELQLSTSSSAQIEQCLTAGDSGHPGTGSVSTAKSSRDVPGSCGRQDGASNGSSESSELENRECQKRHVQKKGAPVLRRAQSKCGHVSSACRARCSF